MKKSSFTSFAIVLFAGALTGFLWLPLLPLIVPLVTFAVGVKWASSLLDSEADRTSASASKLLHFPNTPISQRQAPQPTAWPSLASLPTPARAGSLPLPKMNFKRQLKESRKAARVLSGLELRKPATSF